MCIPICIRAQKKVFYYFWYRPTLFEVSELSILEFNIFSMQAQVHPNVSMPNSGNFCVRRRFVFLTRFLYTTNNAILPEDETLKLITRIHCEAT